MFRGSAVAIVTPFNEGEVDTLVLKELVHRQIAGGTAAIIPLGTTGEASTLTETERALVIESVVEATAGRVPVIVGIGHNSTAAAIHFAEQAKALGADGLMLLTPYYNKTSPRGLIAHFKTVANATTLPLILYNVPSRTGMNLTPQLLYELRDVHNIVGVKEASGDVSQILEIRRLMPAAFAIFSGNDDQVVPIMACGGQGVISVAANIVPEVMSRLCHDFLTGQRGSALETQLTYKPLIDQLFCEVNPIPVKAALEIMGWAHSEVRLPLVPLTDEHREALSLTLKAYGLGGGRAALSFPRSQVGACE